MRIGSEPGRTEFLMVGLMRGPEGYAAYPMGKGSGAVTAFSLADGFVRIPANTERLPAGTRVRVEVLSRGLRAADLVTVGSHCVGLDAILRALQDDGLITKSIHVGSQGGLAAVRRGECDLAGIHLMDPESGVYNRPYLEAGMRLVPGYRRMQGLVFRPDDPRFVGAASPREAMARALADPECIMINRNAGSGTRVLIDALLDGAQPRPRGSGEIAQRGGERGGPGSGGLGDGHRHGGTTLWPGVPAPPGGALRLRRPRVALGTPGGSAVRGAAREPGDGRDAPGPRL